MDEVDELTKKLRTEVKEYSTLIYDLGRTTCYYSRFYDDRVEFIGNYDTKSVMPVNDVRSGVYAGDFLSSFDTEESVKYFEKALTYNRFVRGSDATRVYRTDIGKAMDLNDETNEVVYTDEILLHYPNRASNIQAMLIGPIVLDTISQKWEKPPQIMAGEAKRDIPGYSEMFREKYNTIWNLR